MTRYLLRRGLSSLIALFLFITFMFFFTEWMIPNDFTVQFALQMNRELREQLQEELGLHRPLWARYLSWLNRLFHGSLGTSFYGMPVVDHLMAHLAPTMLIFVTGTVLSFLLGQWLGKATAWRGPSFLSSTAVFSGIMLYTAFPPLLFFLISHLLSKRLTFARQLLWQSNVFSSLDRTRWRDFPLTPSTVIWYMMLSLVGALLILFLVHKMLQRRGSQLPHWAHPPLLISVWIAIWFVVGFGPHGLELLKFALLPILLYVLLSFGETMLIMRTSMHETMGEAYVRAAQAKGLTSEAVRDRHAARNALLPVLSRLVINIPYLLTGLVIVEDVVKWPGMGHVLFQSLYQQDMPTVMGGLLIVGVVASLSRLSLDVLYAYLDPRIRHRTHLAGGAND